MLELTEAGFIGCVSGRVLSLKRYYFEFGKIRGNAGTRCQSLHCLAGVCRVRFWCGKLGEVSEHGCGGAGCGVIEWREVLAGREGEPKESCVGYRALSGSGKASDDFRGARVCVVIVAAAIVFAAFVMRRRGRVGRCRLRARMARLDFTMRRSW